MKKLLFVFALIVVHNTIISQIPYANQQCKWSMPIISRDATGKQDTIFIGYDPTASGTYTDQIFGEIWFKSHDPLSYYSFVEYDNINPADSILKVNASNAFDFSPYLMTTFTGFQAMLPLTLKWDISKLRSDSLPLPDKGQLPRAQMDIFVQAGFYNPANSCCNISVPILVTDTTLNNYCCTYKDSVQLYGPGSPGQLHGISLLFVVREWTGTPWGTNIFENAIESVSVYPTVVSDKVFVQTASNNRINIIDLNGVLINKHLQTGENDLSNIKPGFYILLIESPSKKLIAYKKIIKL